MVVYLDMLDTAVEEAGVVCPLRAQVVQHVLALVLGVEETAHLLSGDAVFKCKEQK